MYSARDLSVFYVARENLLAAIDTHTAMMGDRCPSVFLEYSRGSALDCWLNKALHNHIIKNRRADTRAVVP